LIRRPKMNESELGQERLSVALPAYPVYP
jgi:hypothetical protein